MVLGHCWPWELSVWTESNMEWASKLLIARQLALGRSCVEMLEDFVAAYPL